MIVGVFEELWIFSDWVVFVNIEGFYLMLDYVKLINEVNLGEELQFEDFDLDEVFLSEGVLESESEFIDLFELVDDYSDLIVLYLIDYMEDDYMEDDYIEFEEKSVYLVVYQE